MSRFHWHRYPNDATVCNALRQIPLNKKLSETKKKLKKSIVLLFCFFNTGSMRVILPTFFVTRIEAPTRCLKCNVELSKGESARVGVAIYVAPKVLVYLHATCFNCLPRSVIPTVGRLCNGDFIKATVIASIKYVAEKQHTPVPNLTDVIARCNRVNERVIFYIRDNMCDFCATPKATKRCSSCHMARYCNEDCIKLHWEKQHKSECKAVKKHPGFLWETVVY